MSDDSSRPSEEVAQVKWQFKEGNEIRRNGEIPPGGGPIPDTVYTVESRLEDTDTGERFYYVSYTVPGTWMGENVEHNLKSAKMVHNLYEIVEDGDADE